MKILVDINHPAHFHFFKNLIGILRDSGHTVYITARRKEMTTQLLEASGFGFEVVSSMGEGRFGLARELLTHERRVYGILKGNGIQMALSIAGTFNAHACRLLSIPCLAFTDTENARFQNAITFPFASAVITPACFKGDIGAKQIRYRGYHELAYLHPNYFSPDPSVLDLLGVNKGEKYAILRFVSWKASHDAGHKGLSKEMKLRAVEEFSRYGKVFISSESRLPAELENYRLPIPPLRIHDALSYASLLFGESATMASECSILGTPAIFIDDVGRGYTEEQERKYGTVCNYTESLPDQAKAIERGVELLGMDGLKEKWQDKRRQLLADTIDVTRWMADLVLGYPGSVASAKKAAV